MFYSWCAGQGFIVADNGCRGRRRPGSGAHIHVDTQLDGATHLYVTLPLD